MAAGPSSLSGGLALLDPDDASKKRWETEYERPWEVLEEDELGSLQSSIDNIHRERRRNQAARLPLTRLGMMRYMIIILDMSRSMELQDLKPTRLQSAAKLLEGFVEAYFDQNPISQLSLCVTRAKKCIVVSELGGSSRRHLAALKSLLVQDCSGEPSLQNSLESALATLRHMPSHISREIIVILGSLNTCDPGDIHATIRSLKSARIQCSVIGLAAEVRVCKTLAEETKGTYRVILDETHFKEILTSHSLPPATEASEPSLVRMGFPAHATKPSLCVCHKDSRGGGGKLSSTGYVCPHCHSKYCELPVECITCGLVLVSAPHLTRSYQHLFPLQAYEEISSGEHSDRFCTACLEEFADKSQVYRCPRCMSTFCLECDSFLHETVSFCPGCSVTKRSNSPLMTPLTNSCS